MTVVTRGTNDVLTFDNNSLEELSKYINRLEVVSAEIKALPVEDGAEPGRYLLLRVKPPKGVNIAGYEWFEEPFTVDIDLEPEDKAG
ncbi:MAG: hypothetical protein DBX49_05415 [Clostridia bacterium]|nr:MAG: hypothetical protein DBX49_05415 [Clostridia bacterium]